MLQKKEMVLQEEPDPESSIGAKDKNGKSQNGSGQHKDADNSNALSWFKGLIKQKASNSETPSLREALEEVIEEFEDSSQQIAAHERVLISNILKLRDMTVVDVMIPRADIVAIPLDTDQKELFALLSEKQFSRLPVYRENLDEVIGTIHIKDIMAELAKGQTNIDLKELIRSVPIVSPAMPVMDLMLQMQQSTKHVAMVVDEYGGIDGLVTINDIVETIVGEIDDEFQNEIQPTLTLNADGTVIADARYDLQEFEEEFGQILEEEEREDIDTLGGLVFSIAGRIPARGEVLKHEESGLNFEILDADPRRVNRIKVKGLSPAS